MYAFYGQDYEFWSYFEACDLIKRIDPRFEYSIVKLWWKHSGTVR